MKLNQQNKLKMKKLNRFLKQYRLKTFFAEEFPGQINDILNEGGNSILTVLGLFLTKNNILNIQDRYQYLLRYYQCFMQHKYGSKKFKELFFKDLTL